MNNFQGQPKNYLPTLYYLKIRAYGLVFGERVVGEGGGGLKRK